MSFEKVKMRIRAAAVSTTESAELTDAQMDLVLQNFRESVRGWSEQELARPRSLEPIHRGVSWWLVRHMGAAWALAAAIAVTGVSVPVGVHFEREHARIEAAKVAEAAAEKAEQKRLAEVQRQSRTIDDEAFLKEMDSDIAQGTPDAMEPLASLMSESRAK